MSKSCKNGSETNRYGVHLSIIRSAIRFSPSNPSPTTKWQISITYIKLSFIWDLKVGSSLFHIDADYNVIIRGYPDFIFTTNIQ
jgi:hypothetical protein